jgi:hypothetical protein
MQNQKLRERPTLPKLTIEELARQYAWQLGHDDYPAADICPYNRAKNPDLHVKYWKGWDAAATGDRRTRAVGSKRQDEARGIRRDSQ